MRTKPQKTMTELQNEATLKSIELNALIEAKLVTDSIARELQGAISDTKKYLAMTESLPITPEMKKDIACQILSAFYEDLRAIADMI